MNGPSTPTGVVRAARREDASAIWDLVRGLADYERLAHLMTGSAAGLERHLFRPGSPIECLVLEEVGELAGYAVFYPTFSTFRAQPMMWLEDLFVLPSQRGKGYGRALFAAVARVSVERGCGRLSWAVLDWNAPAIKFYEALGAVPDQGGWLTYHLGEDRLKAPR